MEMWNLIQKSNINDYYEFASNAFGMQSYGFYKANNGEIYIIEAFINEISKIYIPSKNIDCLKDLIKENDEEKKVECDKS